MSTERLASRIYDKQAILCYGLKAKTNFSYTKAQLERILSHYADLVEEDLTPNEMDESLSI